MLLQNWRIINIEKMMKKLFLVLIIFLITLTGYVSAQGLTKKNLSSFRINVGGLSKQEPFVWLEERTTRFSGKEIYAEGFYPELIRKIFAELEINPEIVLYYYFDDLQTLNLAAKSGVIDYVIGLYYSEEDFLNYDLLYPPIYTNPVTVFLRAEDVGMIKQWEDLETLEGVARSDEDLSELYNAQIRNNPKIIMVKNSYEAFDLLLNKQVDYFLTSIYSGQAEAFRMGITDRITFVKQPQWQVNLFVGMAKGSKTAPEFRDDVIRTIRKQRREEAADQVMVNSMKKWQQKYFNAPLTVFSGKTQKPSAEEPINNSKD